MANAGEAILALGMHKRLEDDFKDALRARDQQHNRYKFIAKSHVHGLRSRLAACSIVEDKLISALKAENANHPLASKEAVEAAVDDELARQCVNPEVIKRTFPDGKLPDGTIVTLEDDSLGNYSIDGVD